MFSSLILNNNNITVDACKHFVIQYIYNRLKPVEKKVINMEEKKLVLSAKKFKADITTIVSARVPTELIKKIEVLAKKTNRNRNEMIQILLTFAVDNAVVEGEEK